MTHAADAGSRAAGTPMFSRSQVLGGLPARRASTILFAIEGATARLVAASRIGRDRHPLNPIDGVAATVQIRLGEASSG